jgi:TolA-binding protein
VKTLPPLSPELEALLAPHRAVLALASAVEARAIARAAAESAEQRAGHTSGRPRWVFAFAAGAVLAFGAGAYATWAAAASSRVPARVAPTASPRADEPRPADLADDDAEPEIEAPAPRAPSPVVHPKPNVRRTSPAPVRPTNAELQLLRAARQDVTRGDFAGALAAIAEHVRRFRNGALIEEREALRVKSLAGLGRREDAQRAAAAFHARFPHSVFLSTFERMKDAER